MRLGEDIHLTYCTNVHPGESWEETWAALRIHIPAVRDRVCPDREFGIGLRLSARAAQELERGGLAAFKRWLEDEGCYVFTLNGFPYGAFHAAPVKARVFEPDWSTPERYAYTCCLARLLAQLLPAGVNGSISTSPIAYARGLTRAEALTMANAGAATLARVAQYLHELEERWERLIRLAIEPEPDGVIETTAGFVRFFEDFLVPSARRTLHRHAEPLLRRYIGLCLDTCHASVVGEDIAAVFPTLRQTGIAVAKLQVSAALRLNWTAADAAMLRARLTRLADPVYLHQVRLPGTGRHYADLMPAIEDGRAGEWRIHFHVPIDVAFVSGLASTQKETAYLLRTCLDGGDCGHLEIETYTWDVLPDARREDLHDSIAREYRWVLERALAEARC